MKTDNTGKKKRLHFGVLMTSTDDPSQSMILDGINEFAKKNDVHITIYLGTYQQVDNDYTSHYETCLTAIKNNDALDGLLFLSGYIVNDIGLDVLADRLTSLHKKTPMISISFAIPGIPTVQTDNIAGIYSSVDHLIKVHQKEEIAFVMGPYGHPEAMERLEGYKKALENNGIEFDERYVLPGNFTMEGGSLAVAELIDNRKLPFDAIAVSDDYAAIGVMHELRRRDILVPSAVSVTGFDDDRVSSSFIPSISTVKQDYQSIGKKSAEKLLRQINGLPVNGITNIPPVFIARQSCGCLQNKQLIEERKYDGTLDSADSLFSFVYPRFLHIFEDTTPPEEVQGWVTTLVGKAIAKPFDTDAFLRLFDEIIISYNHYSDDYFPWHKAMSLLTMAIELYSEEVEHTHTVLSTLTLASTLIHDVCLRNQKNAELAINDFRILLRRVASIFISRFDIDSLAKELHWSLPVLSLNMALVGLYHDQVIINDPEGHRIIDTLIGFDDDRVLNVRNINKSSILYSDFSGIDGFDFERERRTMLFFPLFFENEEIGVLLLPYDQHNRMETYEPLRVNISAAVKGAQLLSRIQALSVTDELTGLFNRRGFFQFALSRLEFLSRNSDVVASVLLMDLDGLKYINDTFGHAEGDIAISAFADILKTTLRKEDIIGRLGGDEFIVLSSVKPDKSSVIGNSDDLLIKRIQECIDLYNNKNHRPYKLSTSIGSVILAEPTEECLDAAIQSADNILYEEKARKKQKGLYTGR